MKKKFMALLLACALTLSFSACTTTKEKVDTTQTKTQISDQKAGTKDTSKEKITITDMNGRKVEVPVPKKLTKVFYASPLGQLMIYTVDPEKMVGTVIKLTPEQLEYLPEAKKKPVIANFDGGKSIDPEKVLASGAQVFISMGPMKINENSKKAADELQKKLKIPVVVVDGQFDQRAQSYRFLGKLFGREKRAEELATYCEKTLKEVDEKVKSIPDKDRLTLYYAEKENGLATEPDTSSHAAVFKYAGAKNVADVELTPGSGMTPVTMEQILKWNPDVIFMGKGKNSPYKEIMSNPNWANLKAVKEKKVYQAPNLPHSWIDRPPSSQQYLGLKYVSNLLYPKTFKYDMVKETKEFFKLFYRVELSDAQAKKLLDIKE